MSDLVDNPEDRFSLVAAHFKSSKTTPLTRVMDKRFTPFRNFLAAPVAERLRALFLNHSITAVSGVGSSPALATCETSQVLLAGVPGRFSRGSPDFAHLLIGLSHMS